MKAKSIYSLMMLSWMLLGTSGMLIGQVELQKNEYKSFWLNKDASVTIENKFGDVIIENWDKDSVRFEIRVNVKAKSMESARELLDRVDFKGTNTGDFLSYMTVFHPYRGKVKNLFMDIVNADRSNITVDYIVYFPKKAHLTISNKFGDIFLSDFKNELRIDLSYGDFKAVSIDGRSDIQLSYGKANIKQINSCKLELKNSEVIIKEAGKLNINSNGTDLELGVVDLIDIDLRRGDLEIAKVKDIIMKGSFSGLTVKVLGQSADIDVRYSTVSIQKIDNGFDKVKVIEQSSDADLNIDGLAFTLDAHMTGGDFSYPRLPEPFVKQTIDEKKNDRKITGSVGQNPRSRLSIVGRSGSIRLYK